MSDAADSTPDSPPRCPSCGASIAPQAVLCVACGYHLTLGVYLGMAVDEQPASKPDDNPFASPAISDLDEGFVAPEPSEPRVFDLTEDGARRAKSVVSDAKNLYFVMFMALCLCGPAWFVLLPWYAYRLHCWHRLNSQFSELRHPNSFAPHGQLAADFQDARSRIFVGIVVGLAYWVFVVLLTMSRIHIR